MEIDHDLNWWVAHLDGVVETPDGYKALCPAHPDVVPSLHISRTPNGEFLVHCFRGCSLKEIIDALGARNGKSHQVASPVTITQITTTSESSDLCQVWEDYTGVPWNEWEQWGVRATGKDIIFTWGSTHVVKKRQGTSKTFNWDPSGSNTPPLWPDVSDRLPDEIWLAEGESDCGVLRHLGLEAYAVTKGAGGKLSLGVWRALRERGVKRAIIVFDTDDAGRMGAEALRELATQAMVQTITVDLSEILDPFKSEKDLRDLWKRIRDVDRVRSLVDSLVPLVYESTRPTRVSLEEFLAVPPIAQPWIVENIWLADTVGMIVGAPKMGKSWLSLDLGISVASGVPFLGSFKVNSPGPVVYIAKEDPDHLLYDRLTKILEAKGFGGKFDEDDTGRRIEIDLPPKPSFPFYMDTSKEFIFSNDHVDSIIQWLKVIKQKHGYISLVIFDPILRMMVNVDEYKATEVGASVFSGAERIRSEIGSGVLLVHHKGKGTAVGKGSYGSMAFHAFSEATLYLQGDEPSDDGWVGVKGEYKSAAESSWAYRFLELEQMYLVEAGFGAQNPTPFRNLEEEVFNMLRNMMGEGATLEALADVSSVHSEPLVREALSNLEANGRAVRQKKTIPNTKGAGTIRQELWFAK